MRLFPKSLKIITSAPQLPENEESFSPDPQNPWGPIGCPDPLENHKFYGFLYKLALSELFSGSQAWNPPDKNS